MSFVFDWEYEIGINFNPVNPYLVSGSYNIDDPKLVEKFLHEDGLLLTLGKEAIERAIESVF